MLKVKELIKSLKEENPEAYVALSSDSEGNAFSLVPSEQFISNEVLMQGELGHQEMYYLTEDFKEKEEMTDFLGNKVEKKGLVNVIILWPSN